MVLPNAGAECNRRKLSGSGTLGNPGRQSAGSAREADIAIASTGTVTMECALFGVPTVTLYKTSWLTYQIARRIVTVKSLTMPNLLAE